MRTVAVPSCRDATAHKVAAARDPGPAGEIQMLAAFDAAGLKVVDRSDMRPKHARAFDETDPLRAARAAELTSLWSLAVP